MINDDLKFPEGEYVPWTQSSGIIRFRHAVVIRHELTYRGNHRRGLVFEEEMICIGKLDSSVQWKCRLETLQILERKSHVLPSPENQCRHAAQVRQASFDLGEK